MRIKSVHKGWEKIGWLHTVLSLERLFMGKACEPVCMYMLKAAQSRKKLKRQAGTAHAHNGKTAEDSRKLSF